MGWPKSVVGWVALIVVVMLVWRNPSGTGHFLFHTLPDKASSFFKG